MTITKSFEQRPRFRLACAFAAGLLLTAGSSAAQTAKAVPPSEEVYKNLKVLQGTPSDSFNQSMHLISGQLGVDCEYCHLEKDRVSDEVKKKDIARDMIAMTAEINRRSFKGAEVVTCYTCHQGKPIPAGPPILPVGDYLKVKPPGPAMPPASERLPFHDRTLVKGHDAVAAANSKPSANASRNSSLDRLIRILAP